MAKISFPEHLRRLEAAMMELYSVAGDNAGFIEVTLWPNNHSKKFFISTIAGRESYGETAEEAGIKFTHIMAGRTEADVPPY